MNKGKILDGITFVLGLALVILLVVFRKDYDVLLYSSSILGALLGICCILKKQNYGYLIVSVAISLLLSTIFYYQEVLKFNDCVTFMICSSVSLLMLLTTIFDGLIKKGIKSKYSVEVTAKVIDLEQNKNVKKECYAPVYEYELDGTIYEIVAPYYLDKNIPNIGDELVVRVDPTNPEQVYFNKSLNEELKEKFVAFILIIVCILIIIGLF